MRNFAILFLFFLNSCSPDRQLLKLKENHPDLVSKKAAEWYPCKSKKTSSDSSKYKEVIKKIKEIDTAYFYTTDTICKLDTLLVEKNCTKVIYKYREILKEIPAVHDTITITDEAGITSLQYQLKQATINSDDYKKKYTHSLWFNIWLLIAIVALVLVIKFK